jgi:hypothetical protein
MKSFNAAGWVGGNTNQDDTCTARQVESQVVEFAALKNPAVLDAMKDQFLGLMGTSVQEREWGDYTTEANGNHQPGGATAKAVRQPDGSIQEVRTDPPGFDPSQPAFAPLPGKYTVAVTGLLYQDTHSKRLEQMVELLKKNNGAVVACEDPIGIAQTLSMSHSMAGAGHATWLRSEPDLSFYPEGCKPVDAATQENFSRMRSDFPKMTNDWLLSASGSVDALLDAIETGCLRTMEAQVDAFQHSRLDRPAYYLGPRGPSPEEIRTARMDGVRYDPQGLLDEANGMIDHPLLEGFKAQYKAWHKDFIERLDEVSEDTIAWLEAPSLLTYIQRYNGLPVGDDRCDGAWLASHLAVALMNLSASDTGKAYFQAESRHPFKFDPKNLPALVIACNDPAVSAELMQASEALKKLAVAEHASFDERLKARAQQSDELIKLAKQSSKVSLAVMRFDKLFGAGAGQKTIMKVGQKELVMGSGQKAIAIGAGLTLAETLGNGAAAGLAGLLLASVVWWAAKNFSTPILWEPMLQIARANALIHAAREQAKEILEEEKKVYEAAKAAGLYKETRQQGHDNRAYFSQNRIGNQLKGMEKDLKKELNGADKFKSAMVKGRVDGALAVFGILNAAIGLRDAENDHDKWIAISQFASGIDDLITFLDMAVEGQIYKTVLPVPKAVPHWPAGMKIDQVPAENVGLMRSLGGKWGIAAGVIAVGVDLFDAVQAIHDEKYGLMVGDLFRIIGTTSTIAGARVGLSVGEAMKTAAAAEAAGSTGAVATAEAANASRLLLATRLTWYGMAIAAVGSVLVAMLQDKLWQNWFRSEPFRDTESAKKKNWIGGASNEPFKSETQMFTKLAAAIEEITEN